MAAGPPSRQRCLSVLLAILAEDEVWPVADVVVDLAARMRSRVLLLGVVGPASPLVVFGGQDRDQLTAQNRAAMERHVRRVASRFPEDVPVTWFVRQGRAAQEILSVGGQHSVDVTLLGAPRPLGAARLRPVARTVARQSRSPVLVVHHRDAGAGGVVPEGGAGVAWRTFARERPR